MRFTSKLMASGIALMLTLTVASPVHAADQAAALKAGNFVASQISDGATGEVGATVDSILALYATGDNDLAAKTDPLVETVRSQTAKYLESGPEAAAKLSIMASSMGEDPRTFAGTDLVAKVTEAVGTDGSFGAFPGPFASSLGIVALSRANVAIPEQMVSYLISGANEDGGYGYAADQPSDADNTGMALLALATAPASAESDEAESKALQWAEKNQAEDGSWAGFNPVNSTAVMGMGVLAAGDSVDEAVGYLVSQQLDDGALPNEGKADLLATSQAALLLGGVTYADVARPEVTIMGSTNEPSVEATDPATEAEAPADAAPSDDGMSPLVWSGGLVVLVAVVGGWLAMRKRTRV